MAVCIPLLYSVILFIIYYPLLLGVVTSTVTLSKHIKEVVLNRNMEGEVCSNVH